MTDGKVCYLQFLASSKQNNRFIIIIDTQFVIAEFCSHAHAHLVRYFYARRCPEDDLTMRAFRDKVPFTINPDSDIGRFAARSQRGIDRSFTMTHSF